MDFEFYETPETFTRYLFWEMAQEGLRIDGNLFEPCVGSGAIPRAAALVQTDLAWVSNDLDPRWNAVHQEDAAKSNVWKRPDVLDCTDWTVSNPPFTPAVEIINHAIKHSRVGVAMHLRASIHEVLKTGIRRTWLAQRTPTGILWLPRFAYQRSKTTGKWTTDSVCACWVIWLKDPRAPQFIRYAPEWVIDDLDAETPAYRARMDEVMAARRVA